MGRVVYQRVGCVAWVGLNRPEALNALDATMADELLEAWRRIDRDPEVAVAVVAGSGGNAFCAGADLGDSRAGPSALADIGAPSLRLAKPLIAAVHGYALGAGCRLAMSVDIVIAATNAQFGYAAAPAGENGFLRRPLRHLPQREALEVVMAGRRIGADRAFALGLLTEVVPADEVLSAAVHWTTRLAADPDTAVRPTEGYHQGGITLMNGVGVPNG